MPPTPRTGADTPERQQLDAVAADLSVVRTAEAAILERAKAAAVAAAGAGISERQIADTLSIHRTVLRDWLGKPRR